MRTARLGHALLLAAAACSSQGGGAGSAADGGTEGAPDATVEASGARDAGVEAAVDAPAEAPSACEGGVPTISNVVVKANPNSVLSATVRFTTDVPMTDQATLANTTPGNALNTVTTPLGAALKTSHKLDLLGMRASSDFTVTPSTP